MLHGRLDWEVKESVLEQFANGGLDILVSTTVVEVGIDVPNATVITILDANRLGLSQLHQLRGRRSRAAFLVTPARLPRMAVTQPTTIA